MGMPVVTVASGGLPVIDVTGSGRGLPVSEAALGRGIAVTKVAAYGTPVSFEASAEASAYIARATGIDAAHSSIMSSLINGLKADGTWGLFDVIHVYAHQTSALALLNLVSSSYSGTLLGAPAFTVNQGFTGVDGSGTVNLKTNFNPTTAVSPKYTTSSCHISILTLDNSATANAAMGGSGAAPSQCVIYPRFTDNNAYIRINSAGTEGGVPVTDGVGHYFGVRSGTDSFGYKAGVEIAHTVLAAVAGPNVNYPTLGFGNDSGGYQGRGGRVAVATIGAALAAAQVASVTSRFQTALTALNGLGSGPSYTTWNAADKTANITLSNANLTATVTAINASSARGVSGLSSGKYYVEYTLVTIADGAYGCGVATLAAAPGSGVNSVGTAGITGLGTVWVNGGFIGTAVAGMVNGNIASMAIDLGAKLIWFRIAPSGNWNNSPANNPATGVGGVSFSALTLPLYPFIGWSSHASGEVITANFGASAFSGAVPAGFTSGWPA